MPPENDDASQNASAEPKYVTAEEIGNIVNSAVSSHLRRSLGPSIEAALKPALEQFKAAATQAPAATGDEADDKKKGKQSPEMLAMAKQLEELQKGIAERDQKVEAAEKKARDQRAFTDLRSALEGKVRPELLDIVASHIFAVEKRVDFDESGNPLFKATRSLYKGAEPEEVLLPLKSGVEEFLKGDAAKAFLPAPSAGSGAGPLPKRGPTPPQPFNPSKTGNSEAERIQRSMERERIAEERLGKQ